MIPIFTDIIKVLTQHTISHRDQNMFGFTIITNITTKNYTELFSKQYLGHASILTCCCTNSYLHKEIIVLNNL